LIASVRDWAPVELGQVARQPGRLCARDGYLRRPWSGDAIHHSARLTEDTNSLSGGGQNRETFDLTLSTSVKLWQGAEFWANPEIDQGFGFNSTRGVAGFRSAES
jgi:hypothetical protein